MYFTATEAIARADYAHGNGEIAKIIPKDDTRVVDFRKIADDFLIAKRSGNIDAEVLQIIADYGQYAAMKGYDAIAGLMEKIMLYY